MKAITFLFVSSFLLSAILAEVPASQPAEPRLKPNAPAWVVDWFEWAKAEQQAQIAQTREQLAAAPAMVELIRTADIRKTTGKPDGKVGGKRLVFDTSENKLKALQAAKDEVVRLQNAVNNPPGVMELPMPQSASEVKIGAVFGPRTATVIRVLSDSVASVELPIYMMVTVVPENPRGDTRLGTFVGTPHQEERVKERRTILLKGIKAAGHGPMNQIKIDRWMVITGTDPESHLFVGEPFDPSQWVE